jgi:RNA polymerase sigma-70 factor (ECF subfamily)
MKGENYKSPEDLWKKVQEGDMSSFEVLYGKMFSGLCQYAFQLLNDRFLAEETVQDIFLNLWETHSQVYVHGVSLYKYMYRITHNRCMDILKKNKTEKGLLVRLLPSDEWTYLTERYGFDDYLIEQIEADETAALIDRIVEQLPAQCREIFMLSRNEEKTNEEIAQQLGLSESTVRVQLYRAVRKIQEKLLI